MVKYRQSSLIFKIRKLILEQELIQKGDRVLTAVSAGPDSVALFDVLDQLKAELNFDLAIVHYNHNQRKGESATDEKFVKKLGKERGIQVFTGSYQKLKKLSEAEAREARYRFFERILGEWSGDRLAIAHTENDQAETLLLRLIRGTSIWGSSAIPLQRKKIIRPLLKFSRAEVLAHLKERDLKYRLDSSNLNLDFARNRIRHVVLPELEKINSRAVENLAGVAEITKEQNNLFEELVESGYQRVLISQNRQKVSLCLDKKNQLSPLLWSEIIRSGCLKINPQADISKLQLKAVITMINKGLGNKKIKLSSGLQVSLKQGIISIEDIGKTQPVCD